MKEISVLTGRTMKLYLKNPLSILFSFVYMLLFIVLISLFLGDYMAKGMMDVYAEVEGMDFTHIRWLVDATAMAGVLMINCILVPLNVLTIMVQDSNDNRLDSFLVSAAARNKLVVGYWLAPFLAGIVMNILCLFIAEGVTVMNGGEWLSIRSHIEMAGLIIANTFSATSILFAAAMLTKSVSLYSTFTGIMSALAGFLTGAFLPIGMFPANIQKIFVLIPAHHGATLMRSVMTREPLMATFGNVPGQTVKDIFMTSEEIIDIYASENGILYMFGDVQFPFVAMLAIVIGSGVIFMIFSIFWMEHYKK
ncbi:MAG: ABC transporter permease [Lachnospiraceae bacterium]|mgnify:CR=1 FL=1|nr:ABC transporter permease [Lachnospiraceae bacterium]